MISRVGSPCSTVGDGGWGEETEDEIQGIDVIVDFEFTNQIYKVVLGLCYLVACCWEMGGCRKGELYIGRRRDFDA